MESSSAARGGRVTNHLPNRLAEQRQICRAIKIARATTTSSPCVRLVIVHQPVQEQSYSGPRPPSTRPAAFYTSRGIKGWGEQVTKSCAQHSTIVTRAHGASCHLVSPSTSFRGPGPATRTRPAPFIHRAASKGGARGRILQSPGRRHQPTISKLRKPKPRIPITTNARRTRTEYWGPYLIIQIYFYYTTSQAPNHYATPRFCKPNRIAPCL